MKKFSLSFIQKNALTSALDLPKSVATLLTIAIIPLFSIQGSPMHYPVKDPLIETGTLPNGLRYYFVQNPNPENTLELRLAVRSGSVHEEESQRGLAHFVEHMNFKGSRYFSQKELIAYLESIGSQFGADLNAYTSFDKTVYMLQLSTKHPEQVQKGLKVLADWGGFATMEADAIDTERQVIMDELRRRSSPQMRFIEKWLQTSFPTSRYSHRLPIGLEEVITGAPHEELRRFYRDWYRPDRMAVIAIGDIKEMAPFKEELLSYFAPLENPQKDAVEAKTPKLPHETKYAIFVDHELTSSSFSYSFHFPKKNLSPEEFTREGIVRSLLLISMNRRLGQLKETSALALIDPRVDEYSIIDPIETITISNQLTQASPLVEIEELTMELERFSRFGLTLNELNTSKEDLHQQLLHNLEATKTQKSSEIAERCLKHFLGEGPLLSAEQLLDEYQAYIDHISLDDLHQILFSLSPAKAHVISLELIDAKLAPNMDENSLKGIIQAAIKKPLEPYQELELPCNSLILDPLTAVLPIQKNRHDSIDTWELIYPNGIRVIYKKLENEKNVVAGLALSPVGASALSPEELPLLYFLGEYFEKSGAGPFSKAQLQKFLNGKLLSASPFNSLYMKGLSCDARSEDLETLLELLYTLYTVQREDKTAFDRSQVELVEYLMNNLKLPRNYFQDRANRVNTCNNPYLNHPSLEMIRGVKLPALIELSKNFFWNTKDLSLILVGDFEEKKIEEWCNLYVGNLPTKDSSSTPKHPLPIEFPKNHSEIIYKGADQVVLNKLATAITPWNSVEEGRQLDLIAMYIEKKLLEKLRLELNDTYSCQAGIRRYPPYATGGQLEISFSSAAEKAESLTKLTWELLEGVLASPLDHEALSAVKQIALRHHENNLQTNRYWVRQFSSALLFNYPFEDILTYQKRLEAFSPEVAKDLMHRLISLKQRSTISLLPETYDPSSNTQSATTTHE